MFAVEIETFRGERYRKPGRYGYQRDASDVAGILKSRRFDSARGECIKSVRVVNVNTPQKECK